MGLDEVGLGRMVVRSEIVEKVRTGKDKLSEIAYQYKDKTNTYIFILCSSKKQQWAEPP